LPKIKIIDPISSKQDKYKNRPILSYFDLPSLKMKSECFYMSEIDSKQAVGESKCIISNNASKIL